MKMRALGYSQEEIAKELNITQSAISQRLNVINKRSKIKENDDVTFWELLIGLGAARMLQVLFDESFRRSVE